MWKLLHIFRDVYVSKQRAGGQALGKRLLLLH
jgi:hypothetical protein